MVLEHFLEDHQSYMTIEHVNISSIQDHVTLGKKSVFTTDLPLSLI